MTVHAFEAETLDGRTVKLSDYAGQVLLIVNTASACGLTPQYEGLQRLYERYRDRGFAVLGFPCNQFAGQEPGTNEEIRAFCTRNYGVTFPMFAKVEVRGEGAHPLFRYLTGGDDGQIPWNFTKFLIDREGKPVRRYEPKVTPDELAGDIEELLDRG
ncbi:MAG: glutathione peroxidase [Thermobacillus sp. ZCTH02-B1]|uniref:glutathione peroxidase n=1 Tax=Thermobacillus sp. ZCTH02-B1 TaxID=1858795 RepID=UPI000B55BBEF|nr:glutathione peroxidase [Thermobacillus sp. ZCTH02-B1]OUM93996.1 MAG: glutathione peroxidase [Thermobacillus sp. ZCTH02-B1]